MARISTLSGALAAALLTGLGSCAFHSTATRWNGHVGADGEPVFVLTSTYVGAHFAIVVPFIGDITIDEMIDESTGWIEARDGSRLRLVETETSNYWYGVPPISWFVSPVITSVTFEYRPSVTALAKAGVQLPVGAAAEPQR